MTEERELDAYLDLAGLCRGEAGSAPPRSRPAPRWKVEVGWYLARKPGG